MNDPENEPKEDAASEALPGLTLANHFRPTPEILDAIAGKDGTLIRAGRDIIEQRRRMLADHRHLVDPLSRVFRPEPPAPSIEDQVRAIEARQRAEKAKQEAQAGEMVRSMDELAESLRRHAVALEANTRAIEKAWQIHDEPDPAEYCKGD